MTTFITELENILGKEKVLHGETLKTRYSHIWKMDIPLLAKAIVLPTITKDVSRTLAFCSEKKQKVVIHGGLTNLVGSTETNEDEVVISMEKMNNIIEIDEQNRTVTVEPGLVLENLHIAVEEKELLFPLNFGAKGSAQIGGIISTNAGGLRVFRYGMTRNLVLGLEAVLADGTVLSSMKKIIKDNSAYDLKQLFIGSEGTLGVVTKAVLRLVELPKSRNSSFVAIDEYEKVVEFLKHMDKGLGGLLSGYELIWGNTYKTMTSPPSLMSPPLQHGHKYYVLLETLGNDAQKEKNLLLELLEQALEKKIITDAVPAQSDSDLEWFWRIREDVEILNSQCNNEQHFDISLPTPLIGNFIDSLTEKLHSLPNVEKVFPFGHIADGNIHLIIGKKEQSEHHIHEINEIVYSPLQKIGGSVSAEHGIGLHKKEYLHFSRTKSERALMKTIKQALDPNNILNNGKVL